MSKIVKTMVLALSFMLLIITGKAQALETDFHGRVQSTFVLRDNNGMQFGFMDNTEGVQWRNELKFDLTVKPEYDTNPAFRLSKFFLSYRGAYDAIFESRDAYDNVRKKSPDDFELGKDDLETENDLREVFTDLILEDETQRLTMRLGRQITQWGEADGFNVVNIVNPQDNSNLMFFENVEELATPLWMARFNYSKLGIGPFAELGLEFLAVPDIKPHQFAPIEGDCDAPYAFGFKQLKDRPFPGVASSPTDHSGFMGLSLNRIETILPYLLDDLNALNPTATSFAATLGSMGETAGTATVFGLLDADMLDTFLLSSFTHAAGTANFSLLSDPDNPRHSISWREDVPGSDASNMEFGVKLPFTFRNGFTASFYYYHGFQDDPAMDFSEILTAGRITLRHPEFDMYGLSLNTYLSSLNSVLRFEGCVIDKMTFLDLDGVIDSAFNEFLGGFFEEGRPRSGNMKGYSEKVVYQSLIGFDLDRWIHWLNPSKMIGMSFQAYWRHIDAWDHDEYNRPFDEQDNYRFSAFFYSDYWHGRIHPEIFVMFDPEGEGEWMTMTSIKYTHNGKLFYKLSQMSFWGDGHDKAISPFKTPVDLRKTSEISFRIGYNW